MYLQPSRRPRFAGWRPRPNPGCRPRPNRPPRAEASAPRGWIRSRARRRRPRRPRGQPAVSAAQNRPRESMGCGAYKELILRFSKLEDGGSGFRSGPPWLPRIGAASLADDFSERHAPVDLRDLDLDLVPDLRPRDEDHEVRDPRESIAFPSDILDLGLVDLPFLHRNVGRSEARPRIRHPSLHAAAPCRRHVSHPLHGI